MIESIVSPHNCVYFKPCSFILQAFCSTLNSRIEELDNLIFDVTDRARETVTKKLSKFPKLQFLNDLIWLVLCNCEFYHSRIDYEDYVTERFFKFSVLFFNLLSGGSSNCLVYFVPPMNE